MDEKLPASGASIEKHAHRRCKGYGRTVWGLRGCKFKRKIMFFPKHGQNIVLFEKRLSNHPSWARLFHVCVNEIDGWGATSHAKQLHQSLPGHKFEIWEGPSD